MVREALCTGRCSRRLHLRIRNVQTELKMQYSGLQLRWKLRRMRTQYREHFQIDSFTVRDCNAVRNFESTFHHDYLYRSTYMQQGILQIIGYQSIPRSIRLCTYIRSK